MASKQQRLKEKKRRQRQKERRARRGQSPERRAAIEQMKSIARTLAVAPIDRWPGGCDASLARPDFAKFELAMVATKRRPGSIKLQDFEFDYKRGKLSFLPDIDHWAVEEFLWHGVPGDDWHPIDAFLDHAKDEFSPAARQQLRRWKEAELGLFEIGELRDATVGLRPWDAERMEPCGGWMRSIDLSIPGVNLYKGMQGRVTLTYLSPWAPEEDLFCAMGYGMIVPKASAPSLRMHLNLADANLACSRWPWEENRRVKDAYARRWRTRDWQSWLGERITLPLEALVPLAKRGPTVLQIHELLPASRETAEEMGVYFAAGDREDRLVLGATAVMPLNFGSASSEALAEYHAYRQLAGPPPGMRGAPQSTTLDLRR